MSVRTPTRVVVYCPDCRGPRKVSGRQALRIKHGEHSGLCAQCIAPQRGEPTEEDQRFWLEHFSLDECREIADALFS